MHQKTLDSEAASVASTQGKEPNVAQDTLEEKKEISASTAQEASPETTVADLEKSPQPDHRPHVIKDGGATAWLTTLGAWCMLFCVFGLTNSYGVFQDYYVRVHLSNYSPSAIGWIGSIQVFFQFASGLGAGVLFDRGYFYKMMPASAILFLFSNFMLSLAKPQQYYQVFLAQGVGAGLSLGFLFLPAISVLSHHFARRRAVAMGLAMSGSSCGGTIFPILLNKMIAKHGFPWAVRIAAFVCLGLMVISLASMRARPPPPKPVVEGQKAPSVLTIMKDTTYVIAVIAAVFNLVGIFFVVFYLQLFAVTKGVDKNLAFYSLTILNAASIVGRVLPNFLADIIGAYNTVIPVALICGIITFSTWSVQNTAGIICIAIFYGFFSGAYISLIGPLFASLAQSVHEVGLRMGLAFTILSIGGLVGSPIQGALLTGQFHWERPIIFSSVCFFIGTTGLAISRALLVRRKGTWRV